MTSSICPRCAGTNGNHGRVHERYGNGGGGNRPCPNTPAAAPEPTRAILRGAEALRSLYLADQTQPVSYFVESVQTAVTDVLDVEEMAAAYADAQFGPGGWDNAPSIIRNDIWNHMQHVIDTILGKP